MVSFYIRLLIKLYSETDPVVILYPILLCPKPQETNWVTALIIIWSRGCTNSRSWPVSYRLGDQPLWNEETQGAATGANLPH